MEEIWKDIEGYEGLYQVSNMGRVKVFPRFHANSGRGYATKGRILKQCDNGNGYLYVRLNSKHQYVHRLVAQVFVDNPFAYTEINHIDEVKSNNKATNLEWCNHVYNSTYGTKIERTKNTKKLKNSDVAMIATRNKNGSYGAERPVFRIDDKGLKYLYKSINEAARVNNLNPAHICYCCKGIRNKCGNYRWEYAKI